MENQLSKIICQAKYLPEADLADNIWHTICARNKRITNLKLFIFSLVSLASLSGLIPAVKMLSSDFSKSGFYKYLSLVFSDGGSVMSHFREFILSLAEALPVLSIILSLSLIFVFFLSIRYVTKQLEKRGLLLSFNT